MIPRHGCDPWHGGSMRTSWISLCTLGALLRSSCTGKAGARGSGGSTGGETVGSVSSGSGAGGAGGTGTGGAGAGGGGDAIVPCGFDILTSADTSSPDAF